MKFDLVEAFDKEVFVTRVNEYLKNGWTRSGPAIIFGGRGYAIIYIQAFEKTGVGND
jgi:hypothetical protein